MHWNSWTNHIWDLHEREWRKQIEQSREMYEFMKGLAPPLAKMHDARMLAAEEALEKGGTSRAT
jgi:hypothetical protein